MTMILPELPNNGRYTGYWRVSTEDQDPQLQIDAMVAAGVPSERIRGDTMTGATMKRPGLESALRITRDSDVLVVWKLDRLGRSLIGVLDTMKSLEDGGIGLISLTEMLDTKSPMGRMVIRIVLSFAEMEREMISERTKAGMAAAKKRGMRTGPPHRIRDCPKRLAVFAELYRTGRYPGQLKPTEVVRILNEVKGSKLPKMKSVNSLLNWEKKGFNGWTPPTDDPLKLDDE